MTKLNYDKFEEWFRSTCTCLDEDEILELLEVNMQESIDGEDFIFVNSQTQHDWEVWCNAIIYNEGIKCK